VERGAEAGVVGRFLGPLWLPGECQMEGQSQAEIGRTAAASAWRVEKGQLVHPHPSVNRMISGGGGEALGREDQST
jgi:hypothetical protein